MSKKKPLFVIMILLLTLTGCWDARDVERRSLVMGVAFDLAEDGEDHIMTVEIPVLISYSSEGGNGGGGNGDSTVILSTTGSNVAHTVINFELRVWRELSFGHTQVLIISEELARQGIRPYIDYFDRNPRIDRRMKFIIAQGDARDIFESENPREPITSIYLSNMLEQTPTTRVSTQNFQDSLRNLEHNGDTILPRVRGSEIEAVVGGSALIKDFKLHAWLGENETRAAGFLYDSITDGAIPVNVNDIIYTLMLRNSSTTIKPKLDGEQVTFQISIEGEGDIIEVFNPAISGSIHIPVQEIETKINQVITDEIKHLLTKLQEYEADPFQFDKKMYQKYPRYWKDHGTNWKKEILPQANFEVESGFLIRRQGILN